MQILRRANVGLCFLGVLLFGAAFLFVSGDEARFRTAVEGYVKIQVEKKVRATFSAETIERSGAATKLLPKVFQNEAARLQKQIDAQIPELVADVLAAMCGVDCDKKAEFRAAMQERWQAKLSRARISVEQARQIVEGHYEETLVSVRQDLLIFIGSNLLALVTALLLSIFKPRAQFHLVPLSALLFLSTCLASSWYLFGQNWLLTILQGSYWGWAYAGFLSVVFLLLVDIAVNKARVTTEALNVFGAALQPC